MMAKFSRSDSPAVDRFTGYADAVRDELDVYRAPQVRGQTEMVLMPAAEVEALRRFGEVVNAPDVDAGADLRREAAVLEASWHPECSVERHTDWCRARKVYANALRWLADVFDGQAPESDFPRAAEQVEAAFLEFTHRANMRDLEGARRDAAWVPGGVVQSNPGAYHATAVRPETRAAAERLTRARLERDRRVLERDRRVAELRRKHDARFPNHPDNVTRNDVRRRAVKRHGFWADVYAFMVIGTVYALTFGGFWWVMTGELMPGLIGGAIGYCIPARMVWGEMSKKLAKTSAQKDLRPWM